MSDTPFDLSALTPTQRGIVREAISRTRFNFASLVPGLEAQVRRNFIPVLFSDLSRWQVSADGEAVAPAHGEHGHTHDTGYHTIDRTVEGRKRVLGLAWYSGKVEVEATLESNPALAMEVFLAEGAHMVDFFFMTPEQRERIFAVYHGGDPTAHDHGWFEETGNQDYWSWVGESFMYGFIAAFSDVGYTGDAFHHPTTPEIGKQIAHVLQPAREFTCARHVRSSIVHRIASWHERQINDAFQENFVTLEEALAAGHRKCKTCRWLGL